MMPNFVTIGACNGLPLVLHQAITWTNADLYISWIFENKMQWNLNQNTQRFMQKNAF